MSAELLQEELFAARQELALQTRKSKELSAALVEAEAIADEAAGRLKRLEEELQEMRGCKLRLESLEGTVDALQQEASRLKSARSVLDADLKEARATSEAQVRQTAQLQGSAALAKSKADEQTAQLRMLKQQLLDMEEEVRSHRVCATSAEPR